VSDTLSTVDDLVRFVQHMTIDNIVVVEIGHTDSLDITHAVWRQTCGVGIHTPLRVCASRTHEFPAKTLHSTPSHRLAFESEQIIDIPNLVQRVQYMTIDSIAVMDMEDID